MNLWEIQPKLVELLQASPLLQGITILADDGTYPKTPQRESAVQKKGLVLIVWSVEGGGVVHASANGFGIESIASPVVIEENVAVNRATGGTGIVLEQAIQYVRSAIIGQFKPGAPYDTFRLSSPSFHQLGVVNGTRRAAVLVHTLQPIKPA
jgi:hypothetical protein